MRKEILSHEEESLQFMRLREDFKIKKLQLEESGIKMAISQGRPKRRSTGARYKFVKIKQLHAMGRLPAMTKLGATHNKYIRTRGDNFKQRLLRVDVANVFDKKSKKYHKAKIKTILECPANTNFVRRNIMVKGTVIDTDKGKAVITSRPGQDGTVNAVLVQ
jgi:small subunit ribosomal protein S8e